MSKPILLLCMIFVISGCAAQPVAQLPTLAVLPTSAPERPPQPIEFWQVVEGDLDAGAVDRWQFAARAGDPVRLSALGPVHLSLAGPDGGVLGEGEAIEATLAVDGVYTVAVQPAQADAVRYQLSLSYTDRPNPLDFTATPPPMTVGVPTPTPVYDGLGVFIADLANGSTETEALLRGPVQPHVYTFEGRAGDYVTVRMSRLSGTIDPFLRLFGPSGEALAVDGDSGGNRAALLRNIPLWRDGQYSIQADGGGGPGDYQISLTSGDPVPVTPTIIAPPTATPLSSLLNLTPATAVPNAVLEPYVPVIGSLIRAGDVNRHTFAIEESSEISIGVRKLYPDTPLRPMIEIYSPAGTKVSAANANPAGEAIIQLLTLNEPGVYSVFVTGQGGDSGDYVISYGPGTIFEDVRRGPALADTPYESSIGRGGLRDSWEVALNAGDVVTVAASPLNAGALDPVVELFAPDGSLVVSDDNGGGFPNALINEVRAPVSGLYRLKVSASSGVTAGGYRLIWRYINIAPTPTYDPPRILMFALEGNVPEGEYAFYPFQGGVGQRVRVRVTARPASGLDAVAVLIGPDGREIARGDDENGLNPQFTADLPADGTYQVRINGYLSGGAFDLVVDRLF